MMGLCMRKDCILLAAGTSAPPAAFAKADTDPILLLLLSNILWSLSPRKIHDNERL